MNLKPLESESTVTLKGVLHRIIYFNEENHFCIGEFKQAKGEGSVTIKGTLPYVQCGETLDLTGAWVKHPQYGAQFQVSSFEFKLPSTVYGIRQYLGSGLVSGIGKGYADKIVDYFKEDTLKVISEESARLKEIPGIGEQRAKKIKKAWEEQKSIREVFMYLKTYGVSNIQCLKIVKHYGNDAIAVIKNDPYQLIETIQGIGFKTADNIALNIGLPNDSPHRLKAGLFFAIKEIMGAGHTCFTDVLILEKGKELLDVDESLLQEILQSLKDSGDIKVLPKFDLLQLHPYDRAESSIAESLALLQVTPGVIPKIDYEKAIAWAENKAGFTFADSQREAIRNALMSKVSVITGGPGTGKTTILRVLVDVLKAKNARIILAAPTGRAAQRMCQSTGFYAQTIHRLLKYDAESSSFSYEEGRVLNVDFMIVDEASMIDTLLAKSLFSALPPQAHLVLVGDIHQLPSVGPGAVLNDIINSPSITTTYLNKIFRQNKFSTIVSTAHGILEGISGPPNVISSINELENKKDLSFIKVSTPEECIATIEKLVLDYIPKHCKCDSVLDVQLLAPMHKGPVGIDNFNSVLQAKINTQKKSFTMGKYHYKIGDKIIQLKNNYDKNIFNGDMGKIVDIDFENHLFYVDFDGNSVELERVEIADLALAYAISIHKSQGSEFPIIVVPLMKQHFMMLKKNLLYTAITRARKKVFLVGDPVAYAMAVNKKESTNRITFLKEKCVNVLSPIEL